VKSGKRAQSILTAFN